MRGFDVTVVGTGGKMVLPERDSITCGHSHAEDIYNGYNGYFDVTKHSMLYSRSRRIFQSLELLITTSYKMPEVILG